MSRFGALWGAVAIVLAAGGQDAMFANANFAQDAARLLQQVAYV